MRLFRFLARSRLGAAVRVLVKGVEPAPFRDPFFLYDETRFRHYSGHGDPDAEESMRGLIAANCHVLEKGFAMPERRLGFGLNVVRRLVPLVERFESRFGKEDVLVSHASGVLRAYWDLNAAECAAGDRENADAWDSLRRFLEGRSGSGAPVVRFKRDEFFSKRDAPFPEFARSRHTIRHYVAGRSVSMERIRAAVDVARETPSSCNRQPCRVRCLSDRDVMAKVLELQGGSRGFGHLADKLLVVTADLADCTHERERSDAAVCGGMFLMSLSYALFYGKIAHCILNWSRSPAEDAAFRKLVGIAPSENVIAILACGEAPDEFAVCASPRKPLSEVFVPCNISGPPAKGEGTR